MAAWFDGFAARDHAVNGQTIHARTGGRADGPPLLLVHGFPQTHAIWHRVAQALGHDRFALCGHDRGGRVAHRLALDHPHAVTRLCLLDIAPTLDMYAATDRAFATAYYHWFHLIQPEPLPERMIGGDALGYLRAKLGGWGSAGGAFMEREAVADYEAAFTPATVHAICEDYRASADLDLQHDRASRAAGERIRCDLHVLWGDRGIVGRLFDPIALWQAQCDGRVTGEAVPSGHYIPEELPDRVAAVWSGGPAP